MILPPKASDNVSTLFWLIKNRSLTSIELRQLTHSSFPAARIFNLIKDHKVNIKRTHERYINRHGKTSHITRYTLGTTIKDAKLIYKKMTA